MVLLGMNVPDSPNFLKRETTTIGTSAVRKLEANSKRSAFRIFSDPDNVDNIFLGYDGNLTTQNTFNIIGPGELFEDSGWLECYKGPIWLISGTASQTIIIEEVILKQIPRGRR